MYAISILDIRRLGRPNLFANAMAVTISGPAMRSFGDKILIENDPAATQSDENSGEKQTGFRSPRSIRFLDSEWKSIKQAAKTRGMNAAELVRHAAVSFATDKFSENSEAFPPEIAAQDRAYLPRRVPAFNAEAR